MAAILDIPEDILSAILGNASEVQARLRLELADDAAYVAGHQ